MYQRIVYCNCGGGIISENTKEEVYSWLSDIKTEKIKLNDLCGLCANNKEQVQKLFSSLQKTLLIACHQRAIIGLIEFAGLHKYENLDFINLRDPLEIQKLETVLKSQNSDKDDTTTIELNAKADWPAWYPVIDYSRCTSCGQCAEFCLFGVYKKENGAIEVINPEGCKINCPACARICPQVAIVFPKYIHGGAISGTDSIDEVSEQKRQMDDLNQILGSDIYQALEQRKLKRQSIIKGGALQKAMEERNAAINNKKLEL